MSLRVSDLCVNTHTTSWLSSIAFVSTIYFMQLYRVARVKKENEVNEQKKPGVCAGRAR